MIYDGTNTLIFFLMFTVHLHMNVNNNLQRMHFLYIYIYITNTWKVLKCGVGEGWRRSVGPIM
jgi:hypothetical protein